MAPEFAGTHTSALFLLVFVGHIRNLSEKLVFNEKETSQLIN